MRISALADCVIEHFKDKPELFGAFADPDFQYSLRDAGRAAASNDDEHTERLLVDLLANRAEEGNSARVRLATSQAIRAADKLSLEALNGLTALWAWSSLMPQGENFAGQISAACQIAGALADLGLPTDTGWVRDIDVLNLGRVYSGGLMSRTPGEKMVQTKVAVNLITGIDAVLSKELLKTVTAAIPEISGQLTPHPLKPNFVKLGGKDKDELLTRLPANAATSAELEQLIAQNGYGSEDAGAIAKLEEITSEVVALKAVAEWWDAVPWVEFTVVGDVVGFVNARRYISFTGAGTVGELLQLRSQ